MAALRSYYYSMFSDLHDSYLLLPHEFFSLFFYHQKETFLVQGQRLRFVSKLLPKYLKLQNNFVD